jgi:hypothetical protein
MASVARGAVADRAVVVWFADRVALLAAARHGRAALESGEGVRRAFHTAGLIGFRERNLFRRECLLSADGGPGNRGVAAMEKFLINLFVTATAISGGDVAGGYDESVVIFALLSGGRLMAIEAVDAALGVFAHFVFVDDGVLGSGVTVGAFAGGADQFGTRLFGFRFGARAIDEEGCDDHREGDGDSDKDVTKGHVFPRRYCGATSTPNEGDFKSEDCSVKSDATERGR